MEKPLLFLFLTFLITFFSFLPLPSYSVDKRQASLIPCIWAGSPNTISYQGRLRESGQPVSGIRSIQFKLFDASSAGTEVFNSGAQAIYVSSGIFGYQLGGQGFKNLSWATSSYWLEISVGGNAMSPREQINAMPYAFMASTAASLNGKGNIQVTGSGPHYILNGNVGIKTTTPLTTLEINGITKTLHAEISKTGGYLGFNAYYSGGWRYREDDCSYYIRHNGANLGFYASASGTADSAISPILSIAISSNGNVGIGTTIPNGVSTSYTGAVLDIGGGSARGVLRLGSNSGGSHFTLMNKNENTATTLSIGALGNEDILVVKNNGNVGIGNTNPQAKLDISGSLKASGLSVQVSSLTTDQSNLTSKTFTAMPSLTPITFTVPPSGRVMVILHTQATVTGSGTVAYFRFRLSTGETANAGFLGAAGDYFSWLSTSVSGTNIFTGLTPGQSTTLYVDYCLNSAAPGALLIRTSASAGLECLRVTEIDMP